MSDLRALVEEADSLNSPLVEIDNTIRQAITHAFEVDTLVEYIEILDGLYTHATNKNRILTNNHSSWNRRVLMLFSRQSLSPLPSFVSRSTYV